MSSSPGIARAPREQKARAVLGDHGRADGGRQVGVLAEHRRRPRTGQRGARDVLLAVRLDMPEQRVEEHVHGIAYGVLQAEEPRLLHHLRAGGAAAERLMRGHRVGAARDPRAVGYVAEIERHEGGAVVVEPHIVERARRGHPADLPVHVQALRSYPRQGQAPGIGAGRVVRVPGGVQYVPPALKPARIEV